MVLDSAVYHVFEPGPERDKYVGTIDKLVKPGGDKGLKYGSVASLLVLGWRGAPHLYL